MFHPECFNVAGNVSAVFQSKFLIYLYLFSFETLKHLILIEYINRGIREIREENTSLILSKSPKYINI